MFEELYSWFLNEIKPTPNEVIVWIDEGNMKSIMKIPCDEFGYPEYKQISTMSMQMKHLKACVSGNDVIDNVTVLKKDIYLDSPIVVLNNFHRVLVWKGRLWGEDMETLENIDIKTLQKMVTSAIDKQECIVLENVSDLISSIKDLEK